MHIGLDEKHKQLDFRTLSLNTDLFLEVARRFFLDIGILILIRIQSWSLKGPNLLINTNILYSLTSHLLELLLS